MITYETQTVKQKLHTLLTTKDSKRLIRQMDNDEWQEIFSYMKEINTPTKETKMRRCATTPLVINRRWSLTDNDGVVTDILTSNTYVKFINSVLSELRKGNEDYCYYVYQISDLLKFLPDLEVILGKDGIFYCRNI